MAIWEASLKDDVSATAKKMDKALGLLDDRASILFKASNGNIKTFTEGLKNSGVAANDATLIAKRYGDALSQARKDTLGLTDASKGLKSALAQVGIGALRTVGEKLSNIPTNLVSGIAAVGEKIYDVGKGLVDSVIDAAQFRQDALSGLEYMLGSKEAAVKIFADAQKLAADTPLDTDKVISGIKQLVTSGFTGEDSTLLFKAVADQESKKAGQGDATIAAFSRVKGRGVATGEDLESFRVAGFNEEAIMKELRAKESLAPLFKNIKKDATKEEVAKGVKKVLGEGKIGSTTFLNAAIASLEKGSKNGDKDIGEFAKKMGKVSLTGTISNFKSAFGDLLKSTDVQNWKGIQALQGFLTKITEALQSDVGKGLLKTIEDIIDSLLGGLSKITDSDIKGFVVTISKIGEGAVDVIKNAWDWLDKLLHAEPGNFVETIKDVLVDIGSYIGKGLYEGFKSAAFGESVEEFTRKQRRHALNDEGLSNRQDAALQRTIGRVNEQAAASAALGGFLAGDALPNSSASKGTITDIPEFADGAIVSGRTLAFVGEAGPEAIVPLNTTAGYNAGSIASLQGVGAASAGAAAGRGGIGSLTVNVSVAGGADAQATGGIIADVVVERIMMNYFERAAQEG